MDQIPDPYQNEPQFRPRSPMAKPAAVPDAHLDYFMQEDAPSLVPRQGSSSSSSSSSSTSSVCGPKDTTGPCERPHSGSDSTMPIVVGTVVPIVIAIVVMIFLHRRHVRKLRKEDAEDKHGSLDFGMGEGRRPQPTKSRRWKKQPPPPPPEMTMAEAKLALRGQRGLSIDMGNNPYLLPAGLANSRESLHSMSRSANLGDDKYQRTNFVPDDGSIRSPSARGLRHDDSSSFSGSTRFRNDADSSRSLIHGNGAPPRPAPPPKAFSPGPVERTTSPAPANLLAPNMGDVRESTISTTSNTAAFRASNNYLGAFIRGGAATEPKKEEPSKSTNFMVTEQEVIPTPEKETRPATAAMPAIVMNEPPLEFGRLSEHSNPNAPLNFGVDHQAPSQTASPPVEREPRLPQFNVMDFDSQASTPKESRETSQYDASKKASVDHGRATSSFATTQATAVDQSRTTSGYNEYNQSQAPSGQHSRQESQSQPQQYHQYEGEDDYYDPEDTYSVYDEYGEDYPDQRRMTWGMRPLPPDDPSENPEQRANRIRSFYKEYFDESGKPGGHVAQYYDGSEDYYDDYYEQQHYPPPRNMSAMGGRNRAMSNGSYMSYGYGGPRAYSSASGNYGRPPPRQKMPPKKKTAMPKALNVLPTPSALKDDTFLLNMAADFAPPDRAKMQRSGTPDSRRGGQRPYSPSVRAFTPLQSSYDDLAVLPSPHLLRKSGTFTALDFAPPGRIGGPDSMSESGSIRSARSGISRMHEDSIRKGAYRVSRIPREVAGTRDEIQDALKPKWDMNR